MKYRAEIDGLRAIAVVSVILYHAQVSVFGIEFFQGGFIGVDVFFVISGYLITAIILKDIQQGKFTFKGFYERRARRILPALFVVLICSLPFAWIYLLPAAHENYARSLISSLLFMSNMYFAGADSYTGEESIFTPLLHTWSLSVEEQYYILFPAFLYFSIKRNRAISYILVLILLSLSFSYYGSKNFPTVNFFLLPSRIWELFVGAALAALEVRNKRLPSPALQKIMPVAGLLAVLISAVTFDNDILQQPIMLAIPVLAAASIIWFTTPQSPIFKTLANRPMVGLGLISYSLYLWHQPVLVFERIRSGSGDISGISLVMCLVVILLLSYGSWRFIETPFRQKSLVKGRAFAFTTIGTATLALVFSASILSSSGYPERFPVLQALSVSQPPWDALEQNGVSCFQRDVGEHCVFPAKEENANWILVGDSIFASMQAELQSALAKRNEGLIPLTMSGCYYARHVVTVKNGQLYKCTPQRTEARTTIIQNHPKSIVVLGGALPILIDGSDFSYKRREPYLKETAPILRPETGFGDGIEPGEYVKNQIIKTVENLLSSGHLVVLIYPVPDYGKSLRTLLLTETAIIPDLAKDQLSLDTKVVMRRVEKSYQVLDAIADHDQLIRIYPVDIFCDTYLEGRCATHDKEGVFYYDDNHPSLYGSTKIIQSVLNAVDAKLLKSQ